MHNAKSVERFLIFFKSIDSEVRKMAGEWWRGTMHGHRGYFPKQVELTSLSLSPSR
jgi:hypothetical protein